MRSGIQTPLGGLSSPLSARAGGSEILPNSWANIRRINDANLANLNVTLSDDVTAWGDSLTAGTGDGNTASDSWVPELGQYFTNTINNEGVGGETSTEIMARITAAAAGQKNDHAPTMWGTNDGSGGSYEASTIISNYDAAAATLTGNYVFIGGFQTSPFGVFEENGVASRDVWSHLVATYPDNALSLWCAMARELVDDPAAEDYLLQGNFVPLQIDPTNLHFGDASGLKKDVARAIAAADGSGAPYPHEEITPVRYVAGSSAGTVVHTFRKLGTVTSWSIVSGNDDGAFSINATGQVLATATPFTDDFRELIIRAENANGYTLARLLVSLAAPDNDYSQAARCKTKTGAFYYHGDNNPREISFAVLTRFITGGNGRFWNSGNCNFRSNSNGSYTMLLRDTAGATVNSTSVSPGAGWHWVLGSARIDATVAANGLVTYGYDGTVSTKVPTTTDPLLLDTFSTLLTLNQEFAFAGDADIRAMWIGHGFLDWSNSAIRDALFNSSTLAPVATGDGTISGVTPQVWMYGGPGDWASGNNRATANVHPIPTIDAARAQYATATV